MQANFVLFNKYDVGMNNYQNAVVLVLVSTNVDLYYQSSSRRTRLKL